VSKKISANREKVARLKDELSEVAIEVRKLRSLVEALLELLKKAGLPSDPEEALKVVKRMRCSLQKLAAEQEKNREDLEKVLGGKRA